MTPVTVDLHTPLEEGAQRMSADLGSIFQILLALFSAGSSDAPV
ncbi:hypothetical protein [Rhodococcus sp. AW25M09]|nr:hypothetical protein [Rhodococcus sp. AW25M09]